VTRICEIGTLAVTSNRCTRLLQPYHSERLGEKLAQNICHSLLYPQQADVSGSTRIEYN
jgi:hypothetical protein